ncbi:MAG: FAD-dependent oxidoreductase [Rhodothermales bacterium]|nr:FAD-dependent oxidoreductase [Rhodothermales bacterium]
MHLLLVGGGHAMLPLLKGAAPIVRRGVRVTLIDRHPTLFYSGMVPEHLGGVYTRDEVEVDLVRLCAASGVAFHRAEVTRLHRDPPGVTTADGQTIRCDLAAFDVGGLNPLRDRAGNAVPTKPLHQIGALEAFVRAALAAAGPTQTVVVVGGGAAGTEVALNLSARTRAVRPEALRLELVDPGERLLAEFPPAMGRYARRRLEERGVSVHLQTRVERVEGHDVVLGSGARLRADRVLWATGTEGPPFFREAGLPTDERGFLWVDRTLQCGAAPWLFAAGDCAVLRGHERLARVGVHAVKQGPVLRRNVRVALDALAGGRSLDRLALRSFRPYPLAPLILSTGQREGLLATDRWWIRGTPALRLKHLVDRRWMRKYAPAWDRPLWSMADLAAAGPAVS